MRPCAGPHELTPTEARVYRILVEEGIRDRELAKRVGYSIGGLRTCIHRILEKKGAISRLQLVVQHWKAKAQ